VLNALSRADRSYRCNYSSSSLLGLVAIVQAGMAVAGVALCSVPLTLEVIGETEGLPPSMTWRSACFAIAMPRLLL